MVRLRAACQALGITYGEFVHFAVLQALAELEGYARAEYQARQANAVTRGSAPVGAGTGRLNGWPVSISSPVTAAARNPCPPTPEPTATIKPAGKAGAWA
jgi:hypothetical protein